MCEALEPRLLLAADLGAATVQAPAAPPPVVQLLPSPDAITLAPLSSPVGTGFKQVDSATPLTQPQFVATTPTLSLSLDNISASFGLHSADGSSADITLKALGGNASVAPVGLAPLASQPGAYAQVFYDEVYQGIDLLYYQRGDGALEYDWVVAPQFDTHTIRMSFEGALGAEIEADGDLNLHTRAGDLIQKAPDIYQTIDGQRRHVDGHFVLLNGAAGQIEVGFEVGDYDHSQTLVVDPVLGYSTYVGGSENDYLSGSVTDQAGNTYVVGTTRSPAIGGAIVTTDASETHVFWAKYNPKGEQVWVQILANPTGPDLVTSSYSGGIALDANDNPYITYVTSQYIFKQDADGNLIELTRDDARLHVTPLSDDGSLLLDEDLVLLQTDAAAPTPDSNPDYVYGVGGGAIVSGPDGSLYVSAFQLRASFGQLDGFLFKVNPASGIEFKQGFFQMPSAVAVDAQQNIYLAFSTNRQDLPVSDNAIKSRADETPSNSADSDIYLMYLDPTASGLIGATYLGGDFNDFAGGIAVDPTEPGVVYVVGATGSPDFPIVDGFQTTIQTDVQYYPYDGFIAKVDLSEMTVLRSTFLGGRGEDQLTGVALDAAGNVYVSGQTNSVDFPVANALFSTYTPGPAITNWSHTFDQVVAKLDAGLSTLLFSTYMGGSGHDSLLDFGFQFGGGPGISVDAAGTIHVFGTTRSADFPVVHADQPTFGDGVIDGVLYALQQRTTLTGQGIQASEGVDFDAVVATFVNPRLNSTSDQFEATIDWGDGSTSVGSIELLAGGTRVYEVSGTHRYAAAGAYIVRVTVVDQTDDSLSPLPNVDLSHREGSQISPSIAQDPTQPRHLVTVATSEHTADLGPGILLTWTQNNGETWTTRLIGNGSDDLPTAFDSPDALFDDHGNLYVAYLADDGSKAVVLLSRDGGKTFEKDPLTSISAGSSGPALGRPRLTWNAARHEIWLSVLDEEGGLLKMAGASVSGPGQILPFSSSSIDVGHDTGDVDISAGPDGALVIVWEQLNPDGGIQLKSVRDEDGLGVNPPAAPRIILAAGRSAPITIPTFGDLKLGLAPVLAWDNSHGPHRGRLYLVFQDLSYSDTTGFGSDLDVYLTWTDDGGVNWSEPVVVAGDNAGQQALPTLAVDPVTGVLAVGWYDADTVSHGLDVSFTAAVSADGGATFSTPVVLASQVSLPSSSDISDLGKTEGPGHAPRLVFLNRTLHAVWADNSNLSDENVTAPDYEIATVTLGVIDVAPARPLIRPQPISAVKGQAYSGTVATFTIGNTSRFAQQFTARINWGDGSTTVGTITQQGGDAGSVFTVSGSHTYAEAGAYPVSVRIFDTVSQAPSYAISDVTARQGSQVDPAIAIDPRDANHVYAVATDDSGRAAAGLIFSRSQDGGVTWTSVLACDGTDGFPPALGNARVAIDNYGNLFIAYLSTSEPSAVVLLTSRDGGDNFTLVRTFADADAASHLVLALGPGRNGSNGSIWLGWQRGSLPFQTVMAAGADITALGSISGFQVHDVATALFDGTFRDVSDIAIGPQGQVMLTYAQGSTADPGQSRIFIQSDPDGLGSAPFGAANRVFDAFIDPSMHLAAQPALPLQVGARIAWDRSSGPHAGRVYMVYMAAPTSNVPGALLDDTDIKVFFSDNNGQSWSDDVTVAVSDDLNLTSAEFLPSIAVDPTSGNVAIGWYRSNGGAADATFPVFALSSDGGLTWNQTDYVPGAANVDPAAPTAGVGSNQSPFGATLGLAFVGGMLQPIWLDNSTTLAGNPDPQRFDAANARIAIAEVTRLPLQVTGLPIKGVTGSDATIQVATFIDSDASLPATSYAARIDWGDGSDASDGSVTKNTDGSFTVSGSHDYQTAGDYTVTVTITGPRVTGQTSLAAAIEDAPRQLTFANEGSVRETREAEFTEVLALLTDENHNSVADDFVATIDWGDGSLSEGEVLLSLDGDVSTGSPNTFSISGTHTYLSEQSFAVKISVRVKTNEGQPIDASGTVVSADPEITLDTALDVEHVFAGLTIGDRQLAVFSVDGDVQSDVGEYIATINWGDGSSDANVAPFVNNDGVTVVGRHTYAAAGIYYATVNIRDDSGNTATAPLVVTVEPEVTAGVRAVGSGLVYDPTRDRFVGDLVITNIGTVDISGPIYVVIEGLPDGVTLESTTLQDGAGDPVFKIDQVRLPPGASADPIALTFSNPGRVPVNYTARVFETQAHYDFGATALVFEPNRGQADPAASFIANGRGYSIGLTAGQATLLLSGTPGTVGTVATMRLVGADPLAQGSALDPQSGSSNYLAGATPITGVPHFGRVRYASVYAGIDLEYYGKAGFLEYDWVVRPGADASAIGVSFQGVGSFKLDGSGNLLIDSPSGVLVQRAPVAWQVIGGTRVEVQAAFELRANGVVGLTVGAYDPSVVLTIDPVLVYASALTGGTYGTGGVATDADGNTYVVGTTRRTDLYTRDAFDPELNQPGTSPYDLVDDAFVAKFDRNGALVFSTYLGGGGFGVGGRTTGGAIAVDAAGHVWVGGATTSPLFPKTAADPTPGAVDSTAPGAFIAEFSADGQSLLYSTVLAGRGGVTDLAVDAQGSVYATGAGAYALKLDPTHNGIVYDTALGAVVGSGIAIDGSGQAYITGFTRGGLLVRNALFPDLKVVYGQGDDYDGFVAKLGADGTIAFATYLGGSGIDAGSDIALAPDGSIVIVGTTDSPDFPVASALQGQYSGDRDGFVVRLAGDGSALLSSSFVGGSGSDEINGVAVDAQGRIHLAGTTQSTDFLPTTSDAFQPLWSGGPRSAEDSSEGFYGTLRADGSGFESLSYLGGNGYDGVEALAGDAAGNISLAGRSTSTNLLTRGTLGLSPTGFGAETFVTRVLAQDDGTITLRNIAGVALAGTAFDGLVASFTTTGTETADQFAASIDWGDGTSSAGVVIGNFHDGFRVRGNHLYADPGVRDIAVTLTDSVGRTVHCISTRPGPSAADGVERYRVSLDTQALAGTAAALALQFNAGGLAGAPDAQVHIRNLRVEGGSTGSVSRTGGASGDPVTDALLSPTAALNQLLATLTLGTRLSFDVEIVGGALSHPTNGHFAEVLAMQLLSPDGAALRLPGDAGGALLRIEVLPDGSTRARSSSESVEASALGQCTVNRPATRLTLSVLSFSTQQGQAFAGSVASFTSTDLGQLAAVFSAQIDWGDGSAPSDGTVTGSAGHFSIAGAHVYATPGSYQLTVTLGDGDGSAVIERSPLGGQGELEASPKGPTVYQPSDTVVVDVNGDGQLDLVALDFLGGSNSNQAVLRLNTGNFSFGPEITLPTTRYFWPQAAGDFNGDGFIDLVAAGAASINAQPELHLLLGDGHGGFSAAPAVTLLPGTPAYVTTGDLDGDGRLDVVIGGGFGFAFTDPGRLMVLHGRGDGTFDAPVTQSVGFGNVRPALADMNGDGRLDVVVGISFGTPELKVLLNDGAGGLVESANLQVENLANFTVADVNGDGRLDIAAVDDGLVVFRAEADGSYTALRQDSDAATGSYIAAGDLNGDGRVDLVTSLAAPTALAGRLRTWLGSGNGQFQIAGTVAATSPASFFTLADWNGDGRLDLGVGSDTPHLYLGRGDGTLIAPDTLPAPDRARAVVSFDANQDGLTDLVVGGARGVTVSLNQGGGTFDVAPSIALDGNAPDAVQIADVNGDGHKDLIVGTASGIAVRLADANGGYAAATSYWLGSNVVEFALGDIDGNGSIDIAVSVPAKNQVGSVSGVAILLNDGAGGFNMAGLAASRTGLFGGAGPSSLVLRDLNNDGKLDIAFRHLGAFVGSAFIETGIGVALGQGDGSFADPTFTAAGTIDLRERNALVAGDFNGDGVLDLATVAAGQLNLPGASTNRGLFVLLGNGDGTYHPGQVLLTDGAPFAAPRSLAMADVNGDGRLDLVVSRGQGTSDVYAGLVNETTVLLGQGDGSFTALPAIDAATDPAQLQIADVNGDGRADLIVGEGLFGAAYQLADGSFNVLLGRGDGSFGPRTGYVAGDIRGFGLGDVDGDGKVDVLVANGTTLDLRLLSGRGDGSFRTPVYTDIGVAPSSLTPVDFNGDGVLDLVYSDNLRTVGLLLGLGNGGYTLAGSAEIRFAGGNFNVNAAPHEVTLADLDGNGQQEIVASTIDGIVSVPLDANGHAGTPLFRTPGAGFGYGSSAAFGDFNEDGRLDMADVHISFADSTGRLTLLLGQGNGSFTASPEVVVGASPSTSGSTLATADLNNDGHLDLVVTCEGRADASYRYNGSIAVLLGQGDGSFEAPVFYAPDMPFGALTLADINSDGFIDIAAVRTAVFGSDRGFAVLLNRQDGSFGAPAYYDSGIEQSFDTLVITSADLAGDGAPEIVLSQDNDGLLRIVQNRAAQAGVTVGNPPLALTGTTLNPLVNVAFTAVVGHLTDANPLATAADETATIDWGDGSSSAASIVSDGIGGFDLIGSHTYTAAGTRTIVTTASDGEGASASALGSAVVQGLAAVLSATGDDVSAVVGIATESRVATFSSSNADAVAADFRAVIDWGDGSQSAGRVLALIGGGFEVRGRHAYEQTGEYIVGVHIDDLGGSSASTTANATVGRATSHLPLALNDRVTTLEDTPVAFDVRRNDSDADFEPLQVDVLAGPGRGSLEQLDDGSFVYRPAANQTGADSFTYLLRDTAGHTVSARVDISVTAVNDAPRLAAIGDQVVAPGQRWTVQLQASDADVADVLRFSFDAAPTGASIDSEGRIQWIATADGTVGRFVVRVTDVQGASASRSFSAYVTTVAPPPVQVAPVAVADSFSTPRDVAKVLNVLGNDSDANGDALSVVLVTGPTHGAVVLNPDGSLTYTPALDYSGSDSFTYRASDGLLQSDAVTVSLTVTPVNHPPVLAAVADASVLEGSTFSVTLVGSDADGNAVRYVLDSAPAGASVDAAGVVRWLATDGPAVAAFRVHAADSTGAVSAAISFIVNVTNVAPVINVQAPATARAGTPFKLTLAVSDPGIDRVTQWVIDWGDGTQSSLPGSARRASHTYSAARTGAAIAVSAIDDDGRWNAPVITRDILAAAPASGERGDNDGRETEREREHERATREHEDAQLRERERADADDSERRPPSHVSGAADSRLHTRVVDQTQHRGSRPLARVVAEGDPDAAGTADQPLTAEAIEARLETRPTAEGSKPPPLLQVSSIVATDRGLRVRFNQALSASALAGSGITLLRGEQAMSGTLVIDPDSAGFRFDVDAGELTAGKYRVVLRTDSGAFVTPGGVRLDGDFDGRAGGDYRGRFTIPGAADQTSSVDGAAERDVQTARSGAEAFATFDGGWGGAMSLAFGPRAMLRRRRAPPPAAELVLRDRFSGDELDFAIQAVVPASMAASAHRHKISANAWEIRL